MMSVSPRSVVSAKTILREGTPDEVAAAEAGKVPLEPTANKIISRREAMPKAVKVVVSPKARGAARITVPNGTTPEELIRSGMAREGSESTGQTAKSLGMNVKTYCKTRYIILVVDRGDLLPPDREVADAALAEFNRTHQTTAFARIEPLVRRIYGTSRAPPARAEAKRLEAFEHILGLLSICDNLWSPDGDPARPEKRGISLGAEDELMGHVVVEAP